MIALTRITRWALRAAARRWPAELREEMSREWHAELAEMESRPGTAARRLGYAFSLLTSPPVRDAAGVPQGWAGARRGADAGPGFALMGVALLGAILWGLVEQLAGTYLYETLGFDWGRALANGLFLALWCVPLGWWLGRRLPMSRDGRFGTATPAVLAPVALLPAVLSQRSFEPDLPLLLAVLIWAIGTALLGRAAVRARPGTAVALAVAGVPLVAAVAVALSTLPMVLTWPTGVAGGLEAASWSLLMDSEAIVMPEGILSFAMVGGTVCLYTAYGWLAVVYGLRAAGAEHRPQPAVAPVAGGERPTLPLDAVLAGAVAVAGGAVAWAYTVTVLTPDLPVWSANAPMPGGDGEIYLWAAELRWSAILFAAFGLVVATANRRSALRGALALGGGLLVAEAVLLSAGAAGASGLRVALLTAAAVVVAGWALAGRVLPPGTQDVVRRRVVTVAVAASAAGPLLFFQSTPPENHEFMPLGLPLTTALLAGLGVALGTVTAVATARRLHPPAAAALVGVPLVALAVIAPALGNGTSETGAGWGVLVGLPLAVVVAAVLRRHRERRRGRTALVWAGLTVAGAVATVPLVYVSFSLLMIVPSLLFLVDGTSYPADGLSIVPGAAVLLIPAGLLATWREGGSPAPSAGTAPQSAPIAEPA